MSTNGAVPKGKCKINSDGSVSLQDILSSFNSSIREEHAWALCYKCTKFFIEVLKNNPSSCHLVNDVSQVFLQTDGNVHPNTSLNIKGDPQRKTANQQEIITGLGFVIYSALDQGTNNGEERTISQDLEELINDMISEERSVHNETDDEGIERDSEEGAHMTLQQVLQRCDRHLENLTKYQAESHYRAVVRALVAEALELATFLETVAQGNLVCEGNSRRDLDQLQFADWARFWVQVIAELRQGVKLKKVHFNKAPIEYELTPYEILMKDIRSCRYTLKKIMINGDVPKVTKDAHAIILEFIRSRPPLKKVSDRKLPPRQSTYTPREQLMNSIRKGRKLRQTPLPSLSPTKKQPRDDTHVNSPKRLIKIDFSQLDDDDEDSDSSESGLWQQEEQMQTSNLDAYDLALDCQTRHGRRHTLGILSLEPNIGSQSVPQSRPGSRQSCASSDAEPVPLDPQIARALQDATKPWHEVVSLDDRLSLTLQEIVHIRMVLTKAELETLPVERHVRGDVENRKVCFLCLKTRFGILGPWGHRCTLCKRTVCSKCCSKMNIPMEHFSSVPVVLLSPSIMATPEDEYSVPFAARSKVTDSSPQSSPCTSRPGSSLDRFRSKANAVGKTGNVVDKLRSSQMLVCQDCKMMVSQIIKSAQANRSAIRNKHLQNLTLNLSPVFM
ncbi:PREDICTED: protein spire [Nicrophorus vespilloides]|uniref:Protein spire n=1 Tax=Nicrophorus vespilloides TaxID=110193 RepID=A0ABM1MH00_NICVS|nr:PREDICTED: protein spire [Nicrophorus vespilloides]